MAKSKNRRSLKTRLGVLKRLRPRFPKYFSESFAEVRKVTWPSRKEAWRLTLAVFIFSAIFTVITVVVDYFFKLIAERLY